MATIKSFTDLNQSRRLAEMLPLDSADMCYIPTADDDKGDYLYTAEIKSEIILQDDDEWLPCWSLAALLEALPCRYSAIDMSKAKKFRVYCDKMFSDWYDNPVDACVAMIERLHRIKVVNEWARKMRTNR